MKRSSIALAFVCLLPLSAPAVRAQVDAAVAGCEACHGPGGVSRMSDVPTIAGISALVLEDAIYAYREGDRNCNAEGASALNMCAAAEALDEDTIGALADHYSALPFEAAAQETDPAKAAQGRAIHEQSCEICHSDGGSDPSNDTSILAGQHIDYLRHAMSEYQAGERPQPRAMEARMSPLGPDDIDALAHFYGSQQ